MQFLLLRRFQEGAEGGVLHAANLGEEGFFFDALGGQDVGDVVLHGGVFGQRHALLVAQGLQTSVIGAVGQPPGAVRQAGLHQGGNLGFVERVGQTADQKGPVAFHPGEIQFLLAGQRVGEQL